MPNNHLLSVGLNEGATAIVHQAIPSVSRRGRAAVSNDTGRYEKERRVGFDDGWSNDAPAKIETILEIDTSRSILTRNNSPDIPFDRSLNPYRGCEHGCIYCFARPTHSYLGYSAGLDFETRLVIKPHAAELLAAEFRKPGYVPRTLAIGTNTDPYQPIERDHKIMRSILEVLLEFRHPVSIVTKNALVMRDIDLLSQMADLGLAKVGMSITTLDHRLARKMEPRATTPMKRLAALGQLSAAGIPTMVMAAPMIPKLNDHELETILAAAQSEGAREAGYIILRLPLEVAELFREWLNEHYPERAARIMSYVRESHGGKDYDPQWGKRMRGEGVYARLLKKRFEVTVQRLGLNTGGRALRCDLFCCPPQTGDQMSLWDLMVPD